MAVDRRAAKPRGRPARRAGRPGEKLALAEACAAAVAARRRGVGGQQAVLKPGQLATVVAIGAKRSLELVRIAFQEAVGGPEVIWVDGDNELLVRAEKVRVVFRTGFVLIGVQVFCEQTGESELVVPFATGTSEEPLGLILATEPAPRGPAALVERWGDPILASAWKALLEVARAVAAAAGTDDRREPLQPAALAVTARGMALTPQARHAFDRAAP